MRGTDQVSVPITRPALTVSDKRELGGYQTPPDDGVVVRCRRYVRKQLTCSPSDVRDVVSKRIPILGLLPNYDFRSLLIGDAIAGLTVAILQIPLGMGFALLANIPAICGIYMAFFPVLVYAVLASSQHNSMGAFAVITLMTGKVVNEYATFPEGSPGAPGNATAFLASVNATASAAADMPVTYTPVEVATIVCFMVGVWSVVLGMLSLGSVTVFFNDMLVSGFSTGAAVHVMVSQLKDIFGIKVTPFSGPFKIIYTLSDVISKLPSANVATIVISAVSMFILSVNNEQLKPRLAKVTKIPMPIELIVVIIGTAVSYSINVHETYSVNIVGEIPTGLPMPAMPPFSLAAAVAVDSLVIAIIAYAGSFSLAKIFATKHDYEVDANQELYAMGIGNVISSFFSCAPMAAAIARVLIQDAAGGMTQVAGLVSAFVILWVLLFVGPIFEVLPKACLASIIVVALKEMIMKVFDMIAMWKVSKVDSMLWTVTALAVILIDVDLGLLIGVLVAISVLVVRGQHPKITKLGQLPGTDIYADIGQYKKATEVDGMVILSVEGPLHFANRDNFKAKLFKGSGINPVALKKERMAEAKKNPDYSDDILKQNDTALVSPLMKQIKYLVLDCQGVDACDAPAAKYLARMHGVYGAVGITLCLASVSDDVMRSLEVTGALATITAGRLFHSVHDAVTLLRADNTPTAEEDIVSQF
ncbi:solute carrier family 26 member 6 isoform X1 [Hyalella azteca]|uniref:Solute carrier family 26 member 6 isoform X1 n=1 Tax=Hyalella azteca TaxID=294128 RepID=A0A8B7N625_HYAAZ|nr:solute carrier family 26 member 6 isoform X1 [Hyalella azteca]XP_047739420.1 solute carrier family 26 member 6 isoform X1 [Hyalella azteca]